MTMLGMLVADGLDVPFNSMEVVLSPAEQKRGSAQITGGSHNTRVLWDPALPGFTRVDAAAYVPVAPGVRAQINVENLLGRKYYATSHGNNNIMPGTPRTVRVSVNTSMR